MPTLSRRASFATAALVAALALWTSGAPSVVYPLYAERWHLAPIVTTGIFATYPLALVVVLLVAGDLSDVIGRRLAMMGGLVANLLGTILFALAPGVGLVFAGRALMGVGVALCISPATAAMVEFSRPERRARAGSLTTAATAGGLTLSTLVGGALVQYGPDPLHLSFWALTIPLAAGVVLTVFLPRQVRTRAWRPRLPHPPRAMRGVIVVGALSVVSAFAVGGLVLALGADLARRLLGTSDELVVGAFLAVSSVTIGVVAVATSGIREHVRLAAGAVAAIAGLGMLTLASATASVPVFVGGMAVSGVAYALLFAAGVSLAGTRSPERHRGAVVGAVYLVAYLAQGVTAVALGLVATSGGFLVALEVISPAIIAVTVAAAVSIHVLDASARRCVERPAAAGCAPATGGVATVAPRDEG